MAEPKPVIAITGPTRGAVAPRLCIALGVAMAGGRPYQVRPGDSPPIEEFDGVVISGGHDIEPVLYKSAREVEGRYDPDRDAFESDMIDKALKSNKPLLGICRGAQLINVCLGGSLFQNLNLRHKNAPRKRSVFPVNPVKISADTRLREITGRAEMTVNRLHNQSIDRLGVGLTVNALDDRAIVQGVEGREHSFLIGVQWHPEFLLYAKSNRALFRALVTAASARP